MFFGSVGTLKLNCKVKLFKFSIFATILHYFIFFFTFDSFFFTVILRMCEWCVRSSRSPSNLHPPQKKTFKSINLTLFFIGGVIFRTKLPDQTSLYNLKFNLVYSNRPLCCNFLFVLKFRAYSSSCKLLTLIFKVRIKCIVFLAVFIVLFRREIREDIGKNCFSILT